MGKIFLEGIKEKLENEKQSVEDGLRGFAEKDGKIKGDWDSKYPEHNAGSAGSQMLEEEADEVEEYVTRLPIEHSLETRLKDINLALEKIKKGEYGKCEKCGKAISKERLEVFPAAPRCSDCGR
jgi:RNA polymerase-binding transcription factor DksA